MIVNWNEHKNSKRSIPLEDNFTGDSLVWTHNTHNQEAYNPEGIFCYQTDDRELLQDFIV